MYTFVYEQCSEFVSILPFYSSWSIFGAIYKAMGNKFNVCALHHYATDSSYNAIRYIVQTNTVRNLYWQILSRACCSFTYHTLLKTQTFLTELSLKRSFPSLPLTNKRCVCWTLPMCVSLGERQLIAICMYTDTSVTWRYIPSLRILTPITPGPTLLSGQFQYKTMECNYR